MTRGVIVAVGLLAATLAGASQPRGDATRTRRLLDQEELYFRASPEGLRMAASGFDEPLADVLWVRATLIFGERYFDQEAAVWQEWLASVLEGVNALDPAWRTPYIYGGGMLNASGQREAASQLYERCASALPEDYWCPFARGMNDLLYNDDPAAASRWLAIAAERPNAPSWYGAAAAAMQSRAGSRRAGLAYLEEQLASTDNPGVRASLMEQRGRLLHDELVESWAEECVARREAGHRLKEPGELAPDGFSLPENPRGDAWVVGGDGVVRGAGAERERRARARKNEWGLIRR